MDQTASVEINDVAFCQEHLKEVCDDCGQDYREENDAFYGFDSPERDPLECPSAVLSDDGVYTCESHENPTCSQCFGWKKMIARARAKAKKEGRQS